MPTSPGRSRERATRLERVSALKGDTTVAVIVPAKDEATTIGSVLDMVQIHDHLVDELIVVNDHSSDDTATVADHHGARVVHLQGRSGKGSAMTAGFEASYADIIVFLDADVTQHHGRLRRATHSTSPRTTGHTTGQRLLRTSAAQHAHRRRSGQ